jgi:hypothetical protein
MSWSSAPDHDAYMPPHQLPLVRWFFVGLVASRAAHLLNVVARPHVVVLLFNE